MFNSASDDLLVQVRQSDPDWRRYSEMCAADLEQEHQWAKRNCKTEFSRLQRSERIKDGATRAIEQIVCTVLMGRYSAILNNVQRELDYRLKRRTLPHSVTLKVSISDLKRRLSIGTVYQHLGGRMLPPRHSSRTQPVFCLLHDDHKHPSAQLYLNDNRYWCFTCSQGGDILDLVMLVRGVTLAQAAAELSRI